MNFLNYQICQTNQLLCVEKLHIIISRSKELSSVDDKYLYSLCDVICCPDECVQNFMTKEEFVERQEIIRKYNLSENDIGYIISYRNSDL